MSKGVAARRLATEARDMAAKPPAHILAKPVNDDLFRWMYVVYYLDAPYTGVYFGYINVPHDYPFGAGRKIVMTTPNGRFKPGHNVCTTETSFYSHVTVSMGIEGFLVGFVSFMNDDKDKGEGTLVDSAAARERYARESMAFNLRDATFCKLFPEFGHDRAATLAALATTYGPTAGVARRPAAPAAAAAMDTDAPADDPVDAVRRVAQYEADEALARRMADGAIEVSDDEAAAPVSKNRRRKRRRAEAREIS